MRPLLFLFLPAVAFAGDWSDAYRPRVPCEVQANAPIVAPKCSVCGARCACLNCECDKKPAAVETATARTARLNAVACRTEMLELSTGRHWFRDWTVGEYLAAGGDPATLGTSAAFTAEDRAFLAAKTAAPQANEPTQVTERVSTVRTPLQLPPVVLPSAPPAYYVAPYSVSPPAAPMPARGMSAGFQFRGPFGGGFQAQACVGNR